MKNVRKATTVNLDKRQADFVKERSRDFNFSGFVRDKLDEYMKLLGVYDEEKTN